MKHVITDRGQVYSGLHRYMLTCIICLIKDLFTPLKFKGRSWSMFILTILLAICLFRHVNY